MGTSHATAEDPRPDADSYTNATIPDIKSTNLSQETENWERTYRKRFSQRMIYSYGLFEPLWFGLWKPSVGQDDGAWNPPKDNPFYQCTPRYDGPTPEPISAELEARTRQELIRYYHDIMWYVNTQRIIKQDWLGLQGKMQGLRCAHLPYLTHGDVLPPGLVGVGLIGRDPWLNQTAAVYFEPQFMRCFLGQCWDNGDKMDRSFGVGCPFIIRALSEAWLKDYHNHGETPNLQQDRHFAKPIVLEGQPSQRGATRNTIYTHRIICEELQNAQNKPISPKDPYTWVEHGCEMGPAFRSIIIIVDRQLALRRGKDEAEQRNILYQQCSVLLVRTGDEDYLSAPVNLSALAAAGLTLPLGRSEPAFIDSDGRQQVVRVRLHTAVRFIMDLERRERNASARLTAMKTVLDAQSLCEADTWATEALANADRHGSIDRDMETWGAVRLARAHLDGDLCGLEEHQPCKGFSLRSWD